jgi:hypothetical protein
MRGKAFRRFQELKKKQWVVRVLSPWRPLDESSIGQLAHTPHNCSCYMCGNPRKHWNDKTMQEKRMDDYYKATDEYYDG